MADAYYTKYIAFTSTKSFTLAYNSEALSGLNFEYQVWRGGDYSEWSSLTQGTTIAVSLLNSSSEIRIRGTGNTKLSDISHKEGHPLFNLSGSNISVSGNIAALLDYSVYVGGGGGDYGQNFAVADDYALAGLFYRCEALIDASGLLLSKNIYGKDYEFGSGGSYIYAFLFSHCTNLVTPCAFIESGGDRSPTYGLGIGACWNMFERCTALSELPILPQPSGTNCYANMFSFCSSIRISADKVDNYTKPYIPLYSASSGTSYATEMFSDTGGTFTATPEANKTYYIPANYDVSFNNCKNAVISKDGKDYTIKEIHRVVDGVELIYPVNTDNN